MKFNVGDNKNNIPKEATEVSGQCPMRYKQQYYITINQINQFTKRGLFMQEMTIQK